MKGHKRWMAAKRASDPDFAERQRQATRDWREENRDKDRAAARHWARVHPTEAKARARRTQLRLKYGITPEDYDAMFQAQGGVCAICNQPPSPGRNLSVDHNHETGEVRGLLCVGCNTGVGYHERPIHEAIIAYLDLHGLR